MFFSEPPKLYQIAITDNSIKCVLETLSIVCKSQITLSKDPTCNLMLEVLEVNGVSN